MNSTVPISQRKISKQVNKITNQAKLALTPDEDFETPPESLFTTGAAIGTGIATRRACKALWRRFRGREAPVNPAAQGVTWTDALIWAAAVGAAVGVARVLSRRSTTAAVRHYER